MLEEILNSAQVSRNGRRFFTADQKSYIVKAWEDSGASAPEFCRRYQLIVSMLYKWRKDAMRGAKMGIQNEGELYSKVEIETLQKENDALKKALGESALDNKILKATIEMDKKKDRLRMCK